MIPETKSFTGWLRINWKSGQMEFFKRQPTDTDSPYSVILRVNVTFKIPKRKVQTVEQVIELAEPTVAKIVLEEIT